MLVTKICQIVSDSLLNLILESPTNSKNDNEYYVIPDVYVRNVNSAWIAELDPHTQIKLSINQGYSDLLTSKHTARLDERDRDFIHQNLQHANLFIKSLAGRYSTLLLVAQAIVTRQQYFFEFGGEGNAANEIT